MQWSFGPTLYRAGYLVSIQTGNEKLSTFYISFWCKRNWFIDITHPRPIFTNEYVITIVFPTAAGTLETLKKEFPSGFFSAWESFTRNQLPHIKHSELQRLEEKDEFSVFSIEEEAGRKPFKEEKSSEVLTDSFGEPSKVIVYRVKKRRPEDVRRRDDYYSDGGSDDYEEYDGDHDDGGGGGEGEMPEKKPGPFGKGESNFKCEDTKETLSVTKTDMKFNKKCFDVFETRCKMKFAKGKDIGSQKVCNEFSETRCRTIFRTKFKTKCKTVRKKRCEDTFKTIVDWVFKEKCKTTFEQECTGKGYKKMCHQVPKESCKQTPEKVEKTVKSITCRQVPEKKCKDEPFFVPQKECKDFPREMCTEDPINVDKKVPIKVCSAVPMEKVTTQL